MSAIDRVIWTVGLLSITVSAVAASTALVLMARDRPTPKPRKPELRSVK